MTIIQMKKALRVWAKKRGQSVKVALTPLKGKGFRTALGKFKAMEMGLNSSAIDAATKAELKKWLPISVAKKYKVLATFHAITHGGVRSTASIRNVVLHDMEYSDDVGPDGAAEAVGRMTETRSYGASPHFSVDDDSIQQHLGINVVGWHAQGANQQTIGIEQAGYASWSRATWMKHQATLDRCAWLLARLHKKTGIPLTFVKAAGLKKGQRGITTHWEVSKAFCPGGHVDPGPSYPMDIVMTKAKQYLQET